MKALIDGDLVAFINAASAEGESERFAFSRADRMIEDILHTVEADEYVIYLSGGRNFRYEINPQYKANRKADDPEHRQSTCNHLVRNYVCETTSGYEADDALGAAQTEGTIICTLDKDLLAIPGHHYSWPIIRKGKVSRDATFRIVSELDGLRHFYKQMLIGDSADNLFGVDGIGAVGANKLIDPLEAEEEMKLAVWYYYQIGYGKKAFEIPKTPEETNDRFIMNANCFWIWRQLGETYSIREEIRGC